MSLVSQISALATRIGQEVKLKATLASPVFTGTPAAPTADAGTNTVQIATTAFVAGAVTGVFTGPTYVGDLDDVGVGWVSWLDTDVTHDPDFGPALMQTLRNEDDSARVQMAYSLTGPYAIRYRLGGTWNTWILFNPA